MGATVTGLLNNAGWHVTPLLGRRLQSILQREHKRVERILRREGLKVPQKQKEKGRLWLNEGSCVHLRPERPTHVSLSAMQASPVGQQDL